MLNIHILDSYDLSVLGAVHDYGTFSLTLNYNKVGPFILSIDNRLENSKYFVKDRIIMLESDGLCTGIITNVTIDIDDEGNETRVVKGKSLGHILSHRVINSNGTNEISFEEGHSETVIKNYVSKNAVNAYDEKRNYDNLTIADSKNLGNRIKWQSKFINLSDLVEEISDYENLGWNIRVSLENDEMIFDVYEGKDLSGEVVFSSEIGNVESMAYVYDEYRNKNFAYVAGEIYDLKVEIDPETNEPIVKTETIINATTGEEIEIESPKERRIYQVGDNKATGLDRKEIFIEVKESVDEYIDIPELGLRRLSGLTDIENMEVQIIDNSIFEYGVDYNIGDIVTVSQDDWGISRNLRIISMRIDIDTNGGMRRYLEFGDIVPMLGDRIHSELKDFEPYTKK